MRLNHNLASLNIYRHYIKDLDNQSKAIGRISSGTKLGKAGENPNAIATSERMRLQIRSLEMANRNVQDGISMLQTAEGGMQGITDSLQRMRELAVQAGGATTQGDRDKILGEINTMIDNIDSLANSTEFNGVKLLNSDGEIKTQVGSIVGEEVKIASFDLTSKGLDLKDASGNKLIKLSDDIEIGDAIQTIDNAIDTILSATSKYGALENRFESNYNNLSEASTVITGVESKIRDADIAEEMVNFTKSSLLVEAGNAMMVQSNKFPQDILRILENVK